MNRSQFIASVAFKLGNMPSDDPAYLQIPAALRVGVKLVVTVAVNHDPSNRDRLNILPELRTSWRSVAATIAGTAEMAFPVDMLTVNEIRSYDSTASSLTITTAQLQPMTKCRSLLEYSSLDKGETGYPRRWVRKEGNALVHPLPDANTLTFLEFFGWKKDVDFSVVTDGNATLLMDDDWHDAVAYFAAYELAVNMGWGSDAQTFYTAGETQVALAIDKTGLGEMEDADGIQIEGWLTRGDVYDG